MSHGSEHISKKVRRFIDDAAKVDSDDKENQTKLSDDERDEEEDESYRVGPSEIFGHDNIRPLQRTGHQNFQAVLERHEAMACAWEVRSTQTTPDQSMDLPASPFSVNRLHDGDMKRDDETWPIFRFRCKAGKEKAVVLTLMQQRIQDKEVACLV
ncbi:hypothetical protein AAF712_016445 [Marasmius tenuissimus]|uniref:Uncharacterized protein n=1 Tax=Marasmius tenuissimus TaxID=585030 RepID=A0ABR2Z8X0_9AGAR